MSPAPSPAAPSAPPSPAAPSPQAAGPWSAGSVWPSPRWRCCCIRPSCSAAARCRTGLDGGGGVVLGCGRAQPEGRIMSTADIWWRNLRRARPALALPEQHDTWYFGDSEGLARELLDLVLAGTKTA